MSAANDHQIKVKHQDGDTDEIKYVRQRHESQGKIFNIPIDAQHLQVDVPSKIGAQ